MDCRPLLAQQIPGRAEVEHAKRVLQVWFETQPAWVSVPVYVASVVAIAWLVETIVVAVLRRMSAKTVTKVDDALADGIPMVLRPLFVLMSVHVVIRQLMGDPNSKSGLTDDGELASKAVMVVSILVLAVAIGRLASRMIDAWVDADPSRLPVGPSLKLGMKVALVPIALLAALQAIEYPINSLLTALGVASLAVGLALQDTLKNMFAGIQIVLDRPIRGGDFVDVDGKTRGTVIEIGLRSTKLRTTDNNIVIIPNASIASAMVVNFDVHDRSYVETLSVSVAYGVDTRRVATLLEEIVAGARKDLPAISEEPARATVKSLGESSVDFALAVTFRQFAGRAAVVSELYHRVYEGLRAEGVDIPFPTRTVYLRDERAAPTASRAS